MYNRLHTRIAKKVSAYSLADSTPREQRASNCINSGPEQCTRPRPINFVYNHVSASAVRVKQKGLKEQRRGVGSALAKLHGTRDGYMHIFKNAGTEKI